MNGYGIWKLDFNEDIYLDKLTFTPDPSFDYYAVAIDPDSIKYILNNNEPDVPFGILNEINDNLTKRQVIDLIRLYFADVSKYLNTYLNNIKIKLNIFSFILTKLIIGTLKTSFYYITMNIKF